MAKMSAYGIELAWDPAGGSAFTDIAQVKMITPPGISRESIDVTTHDSANAWMEFIKGMKDGGEVSFDIEYDPDLGSHDATTGLLSDFAEDSDIAAWRLRFPDTNQTTWTFPGFLTAFNPTGDPKADLTASITIKVSGQPTLA